MKVILGTSHYVVLVRYDHNRKKPTGKILCPKLGDLKFWSHTRISRILKCEIKGSLGSSYLLNHKSYA